MRRTLVARKLVNGTWAEGSLGEAFMGLKPTRYLYRFQKDKELSIVSVAGEPVRAQPGELLVVLEEGWKLESAPESCSVRFEGTRDQLDVMADIGGIVRASPFDHPGAVPSVSVQEQDQRHATHQSQAGGP